MCAYKKMVSGRREIEGESGSMKIIESDDDSLRLEKERIEMNSKGE